MGTDLLLLLTALIWGFAFVAQRAGMDFMGPFTYNALRFALGSLSLLPLYFSLRKNKDFFPQQITAKTLLLGGGITGLALFLGASLQQVGLLGTTAGNAGFITGFYVVLVPLLALFWRSRTHALNWLGALLALGGMYFLSVGKDFSISPYDLIVLLGALIWAIHVHLVAKFSSLVGAIRLSIIQFAICALLSALVGIFTEPFDWQIVQQGAIPVLYGGLLSVGVAYTLQVVVLRKADPTHAAILLSLESLFAFVGGALILHEDVTPRAVAGCVLMLAGMIISQLAGRWGKKRAMQAQ